MLSSLFRKVMVIASMMAMRWFDNFVKPFTSPKRDSADKNTTLGKNLQECQ